MNAEIIAIGSELLLGQIANTNAQFISKQLASIGVNVYYHSVVGDNEARVKEVLLQAKQRSTLVVLTGGLGPTKDDLTKEAIASFLNRNLVEHEYSLHKIQKYFEDRARVMTDNNRKQALVFEGSSVFPNEYGMAPGMALEESGVHYMLLPGPPKEMQPMFAKDGLRYILSHLEQTEKISSRVLRFFDIGESQLETEIVDLIDNQKNPTIAPLASEGEVTLRLTVKHSNHNEGMQLLDDLEEKILARVGPYFYGYGETSLLEEVVETLKEQKLTISAAESLTGGRFSEALTSMEGCSSFFKGSIVCYSNEVKQSILQVTKETIDQYGSVSMQCAKQLAENVKNMMNTNIGISFTGVAGPTSIESKDVGTVYIGVSIDHRPTEVYKLQLAGIRELIQNRTVKHGLYLILKQMNKGGRKE